MISEPTGDILDFRESQFYPLAYPEVLKKAVKFFLKACVTSREKTANQAVLRFR
jgi:hypothetical protein